MSHRYACCCPRSMRRVLTDCMQTVATNLPRLLDARAKTALLLDYVLAERASVTGPRISALQHSASPSRMTDTHVCCKLRGKQSARPKVVSEKLQKKLRKANFKPVNAIAGRLAVFQHCVHHIEPCLVAFPAFGCSLDVMIVSTKYSLHLSQNRACMVLRQCHNSGRRASINKPHAVPARYVAQFCPSSLNARSDTIFIGIPRASVNRWCCTGLESSLTKQCVQALSSTDGFPFASLVERRRHSCEWSNVCLFCKCRAASSQPQAATTTPQSKTGPTHPRSTHRNFDVELVCPICLQTEFKIDASTGPTYR